MNTTITMTRPSRRVRPEQWRRYTDIKAFFDMTPQPGPRSANVRPLSHEYVRTARLVRNGDAYTVTLRSEPLLTWTPEALTIYPIRTQGGDHALRTAINTNLLFADMALPHTNGVLWVAGDQPYDPDHTYRHWGKTRHEYHVVQFRQGKQPIVLREALTNGVEHFVVDMETTAPFVWPRVHQKVAKRVYEEAGVTAFINWAQARIALGGASTTLPPRSKGWMSTKELTTLLPDLTDPTMYEQLLADLLPRNRHMKNKATGMRDDLLSALMQVTAEPLFHVETTATIPAPRLDAYKRARYQYGRFVPLTPAAD